MLAPLQQQLRSNDCLQDSEQDDMQQRTALEAATATTVATAAAAGPTASTAAAARPGARLTPAAFRAADASSIPQQAAGWQAPALLLSDIDPEVLCELPIEIQLEVRRAARAGSNITGGGSGQQAGSTGRGGAGRQGKGRGGGRQQQQGKQHGSISKYFKKS
jgi:hypothetical protein